MSWLEIILEIVLVLVSAAVITVVLLQPSKSEGISALGGTSETFFSKNKSRTREARLALYTKIGCGVLVAISLAMVLINRFS